MKTTPTIYEQVIITAQRTRELRYQRYGSMERGVFSPSENKRLPKLVEVAIDNFNNNEIGREYLIRAVNRSESARSQKRKISNWKNRV